MGGNEEDDRVLRVRVGRGVHGRLEEAHAGGPGPTEGRVLQRVHDLLVVWKPEWFNLGFDSPTSSY